MSSIIDMFIKTEADVGDTKEELTEHLKEAIKDSSDLKYAKELIDTLCSEVYAVFEVINSKGDIVKVDKFVEELLESYEGYNNNDSEFIEGAIAGLNAVAFFMTSDTDLLLDNVKSSAEAINFEKDAVVLSNKIKETKEKRK